MSDDKLKFAQLFMRKYDRAIGSGVCSFSQTGIGAMNFTNMCVNSDFVPDSDEVILKACKVMRLTEEEIAELMALAAEGREERDA
ncbi:MAG: DUF3349 domain-containing protein [Clostridiales bacterium]|nr:DUF3349 domain-containing protein [Clostridiales bacterium]